MLKRTKSIVTKAFPEAVKVFQRPSVRERFSAIYRRNDWGDPESVSGRGSTLAHTQVIRDELPKLLARLQATSLLDAACGDLNWLRHLELKGIRYIGVDVVPELIEKHRRELAGDGREFLTLDVSKDRLPKADVVLCRDLFIHLSFQHIRKAIRNFKRSGATYLLATSHISVATNIPIPSGEWRSVNLQLPPLNFPQPEEVIVEDESLGKILALWKLQNL